MHFFCHDYCFAVAGVPLVVGIVPTGVVCLIYSTVVSKIILIINPMLNRLQNDYCNFLTHLNAVTVHC